MTNRDDSCDIEEGLLTPPEEFTDEQHRDICIEDYKEDVSETVFKRLVTMYTDFRPPDLAQETPPQTEAAIREWLPGILHGVSMVAWHDDNVVGHAMLVPEDDHDSYELGIYVHHDYQHAGIGTMLMRTLLGSAHKHDINHIWLTVERWNDIAIALYRRMGFEETGFRDVYGSNRSLSVMHMELWFG